MATALRRLHPDCCCCCCCCFCYRYRGSTTALGTVWADDRYRSGLSLYNVYIQDQVYCIFKFFFFLFFLFLSFYSIVFRNAGFRVAARGEGDSRDLPPYRGVARIDRRHNSDGVGDGGGGGGGAIETATCDVCDIHGRGNEREKTKKKGRGEKKTSKFRRYEHTHTHTRGITYKIIYVCVCKRRLLH